MVHAIPAVVMAQVKRHLDLRRQGRQVPSHARLRMAAHLLNTAAVPGELCVKPSSRVLCARVVVASRRDTADEYDYVMVNAVIDERLVKVVIRPPLADRDTV